MALDDTSNILTYFRREASLTSLLLQRPRTVIRCPETFSFIDAPEPAIEVFNAFSRALADPYAKHIRIEQRLVRMTDLCASTVLGVFAESARSKVDVLDGNPPDDSSAREIFDATGLPPLLGIARPANEQFLVHPLVYGPPLAARTDDGSPGDLKRIEGTRLVDYLDTCYRKYGFSLRDSARKYLSDLISEALGNSEDHTRIGQWWMNAYVRQSPTERYGDCHLVLFNLGETIAETLERTSPENKVRKGCQSTLEVLRRRGAFGRRYTEECFWTVAALQPLVTSREQKSTEDFDRGTGTVRMMEAFFELGSTAEGATPVMVLVSGSAHIRLEGDAYQLKDVQTAEGVERRIAFNEACDLRQPPDRRYVRAMRKRFPGTLLSLRFFIDPLKLEQLTGYVTRHT